MILGLGFPTWIQLDPGSIGGRGNRINGQQLETAVYSKDSEQGLTLSQALQQVCAVLLAHLTVEPLPCVLFMGCSGPSYL